MSVFQSLSVVALRQLVSGACSAVGIGGIGDKVVHVLTNRFTDHSQRLTTALQTANERAWKALEIALGGESFWERCKLALARAEDQAFREQVRTFLQVSPLTKPSAEHKDLFRQALQELRAARSRGDLTAGTLAPAELAREAGAFARFDDPQAVVDAEWKLVERAAGELRERCPNLYKILVARTKPGQKPSILAVAVRYYFRRAVETDQELFQGLAISKLEALGEAQEKGFGALTEALSQQGNRLEQMLADLGTIQVTTADTNERVRSLEGQIQKLLEQLQLQNREVRPSDSLSMRSDAERQLVKQLVAEYRALPEEKRRQLPGLLNNLGKLEVAAGDFGEAQQNFETVATLESDPKRKAEAEYNAYQAALQREGWDEALAALRQAVALDPARFAPFPFGKHEPKQILGAGGFGVVFLCRHPHLNRPVVVKSLTTSELDRAVTDVFTEARTLEDLNHPGIIRLRDCDYADTGKSRPYLVMNYFDGVSLEAYVAAQGLLSPDDLLTVAVPVAEALQAAHAHGILHRDVKPANVLVRHDGAGWRVKVIDFGLALRATTFEGRGNFSGPQAQTTMGKTIAGTLHYAAPEQMGKLPGVAVGPYSDVYGFGRSCYFALLGTPEPDDDEKESLPESWRKLLSSCTRRKVANRLQDFTAVLTWLALPAPVATSASVASSQSPTVYGQAVTFTARVNAVPPATGTPTGTVTFMDGEVVLGCETLISGRATRTTTGLSAGTHSITAHYAGGAPFPASTSLPVIQLVTPAPLTVKAGEAIKVQGQDNPPFAVSYSGFVNSESAESLSGKLTFSTPATADSPLGSYPVTPGGFTSTNYVITFVSGTLTVTATTVKKRSGWNVVGNNTPPASLPLPSSEFPPTGNLSGIPRDANNNKVDTAGYAMYATLRKHAGEFKTWMEWETLAKSTYSIREVGNFKCESFASPEEAYLVWVSREKAGKGKTSHVKRRGDTYGYLPPQQQ